MMEQTCPGEPGHERYARQMGYDEATSKNQSTIADLQRQLQQARARRDYSNEVLQAEKQAGLSMKSWYQAAAKSWWDSFRKLEAERDDALRALRLDDPRLWTAVIHIREAHEQRDAAIKRGEYLYRQLGAYCAVLFASNERLESHLCHTCREVLSLMETG